MKKVKIAFIGILLICITIASSWCCSLKNKSIETLYKDVTFMQIVAEVRQQVNEIEYGIKNGKDLKSFYNISPILNNILQTYSYMEGVYIVSDKNELLYSKGKSSNELTLGIADANMLIKGEKLYTDYEDTNYFYLISKISNPDESIAGYVINCINKEAISNIISDYIKQNQWQSILIAIELSGILIWLVCRIKDRTKQMIKKFVYVLFIGVMSVLVIDTGIATVKFYLLTDNICRQSANKIAQSLQLSVNQILDKEVPASKIYDINAWLSKNNNDLEIISNLSVDKNLKIRADVKQGYINEVLRKFIFRMIRLIMACAVGIGIIYGAMLSYKYITLYRGDKKKMIGQKETCSGEKKSVLDLLESDFESNILLISLLEEEKYDALKIVGQSVRVRNKEEGYYIFSLEKEEDFLELTKGIEMGLKTFFITQERYEGMLQKNYEHAKIEKYCSYVLTKEMYQEREDLILPEGYRFVAIDLSWVDYILEHYDNKEFNNREYIEDRIKNAQALGVMYQDRKVAFMLQHKNGESGPLFVEKEFRNYNLATIIIHEYDRRLLKEKELLYALIRPDNIPSCKVAVKNGYKKAKEQVLWVEI